VLTMAEFQKPYPVGEQVREYKILNLVSQSGSETVYKAEHVFLDEVRSLKIIRTNPEDASYKDRFIREARLLSKLRHKHLVRLFEFGALDQDTFFVVLENVEGESVSSRIEKKGRIPYWDAIRIIREAAEALQVAHKHNLIHNNISANCLILVTTPEGNEITKLVDFSLAKAAGTEQGLEPTTHTNLHYSSPEFYSGEGELDQRSDIYSLGVTLYQMIAGHLPFQATSPQEVIKKHLHDDPPQLKEVPHLLNILLKKALSKNKEERQTTAQEFIQDLYRMPPPESADSWSGETVNLDLPEEFMSGFKLAQRYVIESVIGKGGMGTVYKARDTILNVPVALKTINRRITDSERVVERLKREVILARKVAHPNVCRIYDIGEALGQHYVTMEFLEGKTLSEILEERGSLTTETGIPILKQLLLGLQEAHRVGIIHRDLKPQNIMVDTHGRAFIMDFGIAVSEEVRKLTESGIVVGTPWYMSPEQFSSSHVDVRSDIYSFGIVMFELFTARLPYEADTPATVMNAHVEGVMLKPSDLVEIQPHLEKVIQKAMARERENRYQNVSELLADLEAIQETPYAATLVLTRPSLVQPPEAPPNDAVISTEFDKSEEPKGWKRFVSYFKK
jgi:serine/threonine protein kinase